MTLDEAGEIFAYWQDAPPAHLMLQTIARLLGWTPPPAPAPPPSPADIAAAAPPGVALRRGGECGMPPPLGLDAMRAHNRRRAAEIARRGPNAAADALSAGAADA